MCPSVGVAPLPGGMVSAGNGVAPLPAALAATSSAGGRPSRTLSFHQSVDMVTPRTPEGATARASRLRATTSLHFKTMLNPQNRSMLRKIEKQKADQKLQAKQLADLQRKLEREARVIDATIQAKDLTERGPLSSSGAQGEVFKAVWKRMIPVAIKENKSGEWAGDLTAEMQLFLDLHHPHVVACYGILKETGSDGQTVNSIVTEKCSTSLDHFLKDNENWTCFKGAERLNQINLQKSTILLHVSQGLEKLHDMNVLHRDIKCANCVARWHSHVHLVHCLWLLLIAAGVEMCCWTVPRVNAASATTQGTGRSVTSGKRRSSNRHSFASRRQSPGARVTRTASSNASASCL